MQEQNQTTLRARAVVIRAGLVFVPLLAALGVLAPAVSADELVVDDADAAVRITGMWQSSSSTRGFYGGDHLFHAPGGDAASVWWPFPSGGAAGEYQVFARWSSGPNRAAAATYEVSSTGGSTDVHLDQRASGGRWQALGTYTFEPGNKQGVALSGRADGVVIADAIAWVGPLHARHTVDLPGPGAPAGGQELQRGVDDGDQPWRLDPLESARADATAFGFAPTDPMTLVENSAGHARVLAEHGGATYEIRVVQPARLGRLGVWVLSEIRRV